MIIHRETWFLTLAIVLNSVSAFYCPMNQACICQPNYNGGIEINCLMKNDSSFIVNIQPGEYVKVRVYLVTNVLHLPNSNKDLCTSSQHDQQLN